MYIAHIAIQVQLSRADETIDWYLKFFPRSKQLWSLTRDQLSEQTRKENSRLQRIIALQLDTFEIHFLVIQAVVLSASDQFEHLCITVDSLEYFVAKWYELFGNYQMPCLKPPTPIDITNKGFRTTYVYDLNGIKLELRQKI